ncbi:hypothetical protein [Streptomyces sp. cmx-4-9]|uniref:hypothetical protein n=1 Tax=Streptomyces sp. cmx-4-9 TaxID=2790941 RepID=UPI00397F57BD
MRTFRAVAAAVLCAVVLAGCGPSGDGGGDGAPASSAGGAGGAGGPVGASPSASAASSPAAPAPSAPSGSAGPSAPGVPPAAGTLVRVSRSGGFAGQLRTMVVQGDGAWTVLDRQAAQLGAGRLSAPELGRLREALREADFAALPRMSTGGPKVYDGFFFTFVHGGVEVAGEQESLPSVLVTVLEALPPFSAG